MDISKKFGARLRELRRHHRLTQEKLGEKAHVNYKFIGGIERGEENPSLAVLSKLSSALKVPLHELLQVEHIQTEKQLRTLAKKLVDEAKADDLHRVVKVLKALVR